MPMTYTTGPSLTGAFFRSLEDASKVFYAAARGVLPLCSDRLNEAERKQVRPGNVYVYDSTALVRWFVSPSAATLWRPASRLHRSG